MVFLKVLTRVSSPFVDYENIKDKDKFSGYLIEVWERISRQLRIDYSIETSNSSHAILDQMVASNGTYAVGLADFSANFYNQKESYRGIEFSSPYLVTGFGAAIYIEEKKSIKSLSLLASSFSWQVWLTFFGMLFINSLAFLAYTKVNRGCRRPAERFVDENYGFVESLWFSVGTILCQQTDHRPKTMGLRIFTVGWFVFCLVFVTFYLAKMASTLTAASLNFPVNHVNDLPINEDLFNSSIADGFPLLSPSTVIYGTKGKTLRRFYAELEPGTPTKNMWPLMEKWNTTRFQDWSELEAFAKANPGKFAMIRKRIYLENLAAKSPDCDLFVLSGTMNNEYLSIALHRNLDPELRSKISKVILRLGRQGILQSLQSFYWQRQTCSIINARKKMQSGSSLGFENFGGVFVLVAFVYVIAFFSFAAQLLRHVTTTD